MKLSNLIGKKIYSLYETMEVGTTCQALYSKNYSKLLGFYFFDENEDEHFVRFSNIFGFGDVFTIKNFAQISNEFPVDEMPSPLNKPIIDEKGNSLGVLSDLEIDEKGYISHYISSKGQTIPSSEVRANKDFVLCGESIKLATFRPREKKALQENLDNVKVKIMRIEEPPKPSSYMPPKVTISSDSFIGKVVKEDLFGKNNELLLKKNQSITPKALEIIRMHNKLNQLYHVCY